MERTMNEEVLETAQYPEIVFESSKVAASESRRRSVQGGPRRRPCRCTGVIEQPAGFGAVALIGETLRAHGEFSVSQTAYGIKPVPSAGGTLKLKDELKCSFDIVARKQAEVDKGSHVSSDTGKDRRTFPE